VTGRAGRVGIVGGGMLGLTLAHRLRRQGHDVSVLERAASAGGLAAPARLGEYTWDRFYHVILSSDVRLVALLAELGLEHRLRWGDPRTGFWIDGRLHSLSGALEFLRFPPLSLVDKARLAATILHASRITDGRPLEAVAAEAWLRRWSGDRTTDRVWLPLLRAKLGENYRLASAAFIWAIIRRMYAARRNGVGRERFGYVEGGYDTVLRALAARLTADGVTLRTGVRVREVAGDDAGARVVLEDGDTLDFDQVVMTVPCGAVAALCPGLTPAETARLEAVVYQGIVCVSLLLRRPLSGYYVTNVADAGMPFTGVIEMTAVVDPAQFGGHCLVYLPKYLTQADEYWQRDDAEITVEFVAALRRMYPQVQEGDVLAALVSRARQVQALSTLQYSDRLLPPLGTSVPNVFVVNSAQIAQGTLNVNETVTLADDQANALAPLLGARAPSPAPTLPAR
jgi:protoporphyrinogen oxidase